MKFRHRTCLLPLACALAVLPAACGGDEERVELAKQCANNTCASGGTCDDSSGELLCLCRLGYDGNRCQFCASGYADDGAGNCLRDCEAGYQDNDGDGVCRPDCATSALLCEGEHRVCSDASGEAACACEAGYQDNDGDGVCRPDCATSALLCEGEHRVCSDASGEAACACAKGFIERESGACAQMDWTLMVFLNGDNDLEEYADEDLKEMLHMTADEAVNLIVLFDGPGSRDTELYRIENGSRIVLEHATAGIFSGNEADMGDWRVLKKFGVWAAENYPARQYGLFLWNHGGGWKGDGASRCGSPFKEFSSDDTSRSLGIEISNGDFGQALQAISESAGQKIDLVGFDACLMGMYEVAAATADYGQYLVASEETEPGWGWSWDGFLKKLSNKPQMGPIDLGKAIVDAYADYEDPYYGKANDTLSLVDLSAMAELHFKVTAFADALIEALPAHQSTITSLRKEAKEYSYEEHIDFLYFAEMIAEQQNLPSTLKIAANALIAQLEKSIIYNRTNNYIYQDWFEYIAIDHSNSNGMAIFFPMNFSGNYQRSDFISYKNAMWASESTWAAFLDAYL